MYKRKGFRFELLALCAVVASIALACGFVQPPPTPVPLPTLVPIPPGMPVVESDIKLFGHVTHEIEVGTAVTWTNRDQSIHTVTHTPRKRGESIAWDSGRLSFGDSFVYIFNEAGSFRYICSIHMDMIAMITVVENSSE